MFFIERQIFLKIHQIQLLVKNLVLMAYESHE